jgi:hypothetical protein
MCRLIGICADFLSARCYFESTGSSLPQGRVGFAQIVARVTPAASVLTRK